MEMINREWKKKNGLYEKFSLLEQGEAHTSNGKDEYFKEQNMEKFAINCYDCVFVPKEWKGMTTDQPKDFDCECNCGWYKFSKHGGFNFGNLVTYEKK